MGLSTDQKRCVTSVLEDRIRLLRDPKARGEIGVSDVPYRDVGELATDVLAEGADGYGPDGLQHVWILQRFVSDVEDYGDWSPRTSKCVRTFSAENDDDVRDFLQELVRAHAPRATWGIPRRDNLAELKRHLTQM